MADVSFDARPKMVPPAKSGGPWTLAEDWLLTHGETAYCVPAGFETDGASIPRALWWLCGTPLEVPRLYAALVHDYLYCGRGGEEVTRAAADAVYRDILIELDFGRAKAWAEWSALRAFGGSHWQGGEK